MASFIVKLKALICPLVVLLYLAGSSQEADSVQLVDQDVIDMPSIVLSLARLVCDEKATRDYNRHISRVSTILRLADLFETMTDNRELLECRNRTLGPLRELRHILRASNTNVCTEEKVLLIERFHTDHISDNSRDLNRRDSALPTLLRLFFMHYAMEVSATCKRNLINSLERDLDQQLKAQDYAAFETESVAQLMKAFSTSLAGGQIRDLDDVILIWDLVDSLTTRVSPDKLPVELLDANQNGFRVHVKVRDVTHARRMQQMCKLRFRPVYSKLIIPIIRLSNIGYSFQRGLLERELIELRTNPTVKRWYAITQICEAILPMKFHQDPSMPLGGGALISARQAAELEFIQPVEDPSLREIKELHFEPTTNSFEQLDRLYDIESLERQQLVAKVNLKTSRHSRIIWRSVFKILAEFKNIFKAFSIVRLFVSEKKRDSSGVNGLTDVTPKLVNFEVKNETDLPVLNGNLRYRGSSLFKTKISQSLSRVNNKAIGEAIRDWKDAFVSILPSTKEVFLAGIIIVVLLAIGTFCSLGLLMAGTVVGGLIWNALS